MTRPATPVGRRVRDARQRAGLTQVDLADRLGVTQTSVSKTEAAVNLEWSTLVSYAAALGVPVEELITGADA